MKINFERAINAPFKVSGEESIGIVYLIAGLICLGTIVVGIIGQAIIQGFVVVIETFSKNASNPTMIATVVGGVVVAILAISVLNILAYSLPFGYVLETVKYEVNNKEVVMSDWKGNYLKFFLFGLKGQLLLFIYYIIYIMIPVIIFSIPVIILTMSGSSSAKSLEAPVTIVFAVLFLLWIIGISATFPMVMVRYAITGSVLSNLNILFAIKKILENIVDYIVAILVIIAFAFVYAIAGSVLICCTCGLGTLILPIVSGFILPIIILNIFAQIYKH